jgi:ferritin-like metal-binding protein YciE
MAENAKDRIVRYLADAHASEIGSLHALNDIAAQSQADRLEARLNALGAKSNSVKAAVNTIIGKGSDLLNAFHDQEDKQTQDVIKAYALENFEVAFYTAMHTYAAGVGDHETAQLAKMILGEEQLAGERLLRLIPQLAQQAVAKTEGATVAA